MTEAYFDRLEGDKAVLLLGEDFAKVDFPRRYLPAGAAEGDYLQIVISLDQKKKEEAEQEAWELLR